MQGPNESRKRFGQNLSFFIYILLTGVLVVFIGYILAGLPFRGARQTTESMGNQEVFHKLLSPAEFKQKITTYKPDEYVILDVRTPQEFKQGHIENAVLINYYSADFRQKLATLDKNKIYFVYCRSGNRSAQTVKIMKDLGFKRIYELQGGIKNWVANGYQLTK